MKKYEIPTLEIIKLDPRDVISASGATEETEPTTPPGPSINFPCFGQSGNQDGNC